MLSVKIKSILLLAPLLFCAFGLSAATHTTLAWQASDVTPETYRVHYRKKAWSFTRVQDTGAKTTHTFDGLKAGATFTFYVTARAYGIESGKSNVVTYKIK